MKLAIALLLAAAPVSAQTTNTSTSGAASDSASHSAAVSVSSQGQTAQQANGQTMTFNSAQPLPSTRLIDKVVGSNAVPLAASSSFSSDFCGSTTSGGASAFGVSIGAASASYDENCRHLRAAEKFSILAVTAANMKMGEYASKLMSLSAWEMCSINPATQHACEQVNLLPASQVAAAVQSTNAKSAEAAEPARAAMGAASQR